LQPLFVKKLLCKGSGKWDQHSYSKGWCHVRWFQQLLCIWWIVTWSFATCLLTGCNIKLELLVTSDSN
jgi:hypothetical protein